jgi:hypothetical protein
MFWASTSEEGTLGWAARRCEALRLARLYVWQVELDSPEVDVNMHPDRWTAPVTSVMAPSGRFISLVRDVLLVDYRASHQPRPDAADRS